MRSKKKTNPDTQHQLRKDMASKVVELLWMLQTTIANAIAGQALVAPSMWKQAFQAFSQTGPDNSGVNVGDASHLLKTVRLLASAC